MISNQIPSIIPTIEKVFIINHPIHTIGFQNHKKSLKMRWITTQSSRYMQFHSRIIKKEHPCYVMHILYLPWSKLWGIHSKTQDWSLLMPRKPKSPTRHSKTQDLPHLHPNPRANTWIRTQFTKKNPEQLAKWNVGLKLTLMGRGEKDLDDAPCRSKKYGWESLRIQWSLMRMALGLLHRTLACRGRREKRERREGNRKEMEMLLGSLGWLCRLAIGA